MRKFVVALFIVTLLAGLASASETPQCRLGRLQASAGRVELQRAEGGAGRHGAPGGPQ